MPHLHSFLNVLYCFIYACVCVCVCVCIYMRTYICVYVYVYIYVVCCLCGPSCVLNKVIIIITTYWHVGNPSFYSPLITNSTNPNHTKRITVTLPFTVP